jgi:hypothetical protein
VLTGLIVALAVALVLLRKTGVVAKRVGVDQPNAGDTDRH